MALFYFHFHDGRTLSKDDIGLDLDSAEEAYVEAANAAREMWPDLLRSRTDPVGCAFEIANQRGECLFTLEFGDLLASCSPANGRPLAPLSIEMNLHDTHRRAQEAVSSVRSTFQEVRGSLLEVTDLIQQLSRFERPVVRKG